MGRRLITKLADCKTSYDQPVILLLQGFHKVETQMNCKRTEQKNVYIYIYNGFLEYSQGIGGIGILL